MRAFYFSREDKRLGYGDNRLIKTGITHKVAGVPKCCSCGLHGSFRIMAALNHARGPYLWVVDITGNIDTQDDKICGNERTYLAGSNIEDVLRHFARRQALINIEKIRPYTDKYDLIVEWLTTGNEDIKSAAHSAARSAAHSAARFAADSAARSAADSAVHSAARSADWFADWSPADSAAHSAARSAAWFAADSAACSAADSAARSPADSAARSAARSAAWSAADFAARSAARSAAWSASEEMLISMLPSNIRQKLDK